MDTNTTDPIPPSEPPKPSEPVPSPVSEQITFTSPQSQNPIAVPSAPPKPPVSAFGVFVGLIYFPVLYPFLLNIFDLLIPYYLRSELVLILQPLLLIAGLFIPYKYRRTPFGRGFYKGITSAFIAVLVLFALCLLLMSFYS